MRRHLHWFALLVALLTGLAQQGSVVHALSHLGPAQKQTQDQDLPAHKPCAQCLAFAQVDAGALGQSTFALEATVEVTSSRPLALQAIKSLAHHQPIRAPPRLS